MISLDKKSNDTSVALDALRAVAAQLVCVGHTLNIFGIHRNHLADDGVLLFFILSGFVIAHTLVQKSNSDPGYGITGFAIERFSRIYSAYLPALLLIAAIDYTALWFGHELPGDSNDLYTLVGNIFMLEGYPSALGVVTFGSAGQLTTVAVEFHIYFFVGALFFLFRSRSPFACLIVAYLFAAVPLAWFGAADGGRTLFVLWLMGFASYFVANTVVPKLAISIPAAIIAITTLYVWQHPRFSNYYDLEHYPLLIISFTAMVICTQGLKIAGQRFTRTVSFFANYSFSLYLVHFTIVKAIYQMTDQINVWGRLAGCLVVANLIAVGFSWLFEHRYRKLAGLLKLVLLRQRDSKYVPKASPGPPNLDVNVV